MRKAKHQKNLSCFDFDLVDFLPFYFYFLFILTEKTEKLCCYFFCFAFSAFFPSYCVCVLKDFQWFLLRRNKMEYKNISLCVWEFIFILYIFFLSFALLFYGLLLPRDLDFEFYELFWGVAMTFLWFIWGNWSISETISPWMAQKAVAKLRFSTQNLINYCSF